MKWNRVRAAGWLLCLTAMLGACAGSAGPGSTRASNRTAAPASCLTPEKRVLGPEASIAQYMRQAINPGLSALTMTLFHDPRALSDDGRVEQIVSESIVLSDCFAALGDAFRGRSADEMNMLFTMQAHNARALADASMQRDRGAAMHWYQHIKETCQSCHNRYGAEQMGSGHVAP